MAQVVIHRHSAHVEDEDALMLESPEMSKAEAQAQADLIREHICPHIEREVTAEGQPDVTLTHKGDATGTPGIPLELGWVTILNDTIDSVEVV